MLENIEVLYHSCIKFNLNKKIYVDPYGIQKNYNDADIILITHSHFDHFSKCDIEKVRKENTYFLITQDLYDELLNMNVKKENVIVVKPNNQYEILGIKIQTIPAYNVNKKFHPKENNWVRLFNKYSKYYLLYSRRYRYK